MTAWPSRTWWLVLGGCLCVLAVDALSSLHGPIGIWLLLAAPGTASIAVARPRDRMLAMLLVPIVSASLTTVVATALVLAGRWSPLLGATVVAVCTGALVEFGSRTRAAVGS